MSPVMELDLRFSFREAARLLGVDRAAVSAIARGRNLDRGDGKPLDLAGLREIAGILNIPLSDIRLTA